MKIKELLEWVKTIVIAVVLVFIIKLFLFGNYVVEGESMEPNFHDGQNIIVNKILYTFREPDRGEVIVLHAPDGRDFIKRVIGLEGETVEVLGDDVYIDGQVLEEEYLQDIVKEYNDQGLNYNTIDFEEQEVPEGHVFVMGDNRPRSSDSRSVKVGFIPVEDVVGRADIIYWPFSDIQWIRY
ncbi:signal peptidase I [Longirhabdus pacifica]|uniref:signal peptidase I n=1 Tax=Longirhabdus pacifica TaxID=2305227 RepID=UPI001F0B86E1|nr:signal peptidase I [Longirhabdus pacifica]